MLYWLSINFLQHHHALRVMQYLTFRSIGAAVTALCLTLWLCPGVIARLKRLQIGQHVRSDGPQTHLKKSGTPTMGGIIMLLSISISVMLWCDLSNVKVWLVLFVMIFFGLIGWIDDYLKVVKKNSKGLSAKGKLVMQFLFAFCVGLFLYLTASSTEQTSVLIPFLKSGSLDLGVGILFFTVLVIVGSSNAVNLTDGLDGLALMPIVLIGMALAVFAYLSGNAVFAKYLLIYHLPGVGEVAVYCAALVGAGLGFLWFNTFPAEVFMGDVGSLSLGAVLGVIAVLVQQELAFFVMSGVFVAETLSVVLQVTSFKLRGKRIFRMAPLHHHFELKGWPEPKVIVRFWIVTVILVLVGLSTLKLR